MAANVTHDHLIDAFESKFDYQTARAVVGEVLDRAGVKKSDKYDAGALKQIAIAVEALVPTYKQKSILDRIAVSGAVADAAPEPKKAAKVEAAPAEAAPAEAAGDAAAEGGEGHAEAKPEKKKKKE
jgi:hypothetical protein